MRGPPAQARLRDGQRIREPGREREAIKVLIKF
jgi:hypothetical protein